MALRTISVFILMSLIGSVYLTNAQHVCMKNCLRMFLRCARIFDSGCCDSYIPCMRDECKAKFFPCEQQTSMEELKRGSWNKRTQETSELYGMLFPRRME